MGRTSRRRRRRRGKREGMMRVGQGAKGRQVGLFVGAVRDEWQGWRRGGRGREELGGVDHLAAAACCC